MFAADEAPISSENILTPPQNRATLIIQGTDSPEEQADFEQLVSELGGINSNTIVFSPLEEKRQPTKQNLQICLEWIKSPDDFSDTELGLEPIRQIPDLTCELRLFINARGIVRDEQAYFYFSTAQTDDHNGVTTNPEPAVHPNDPFLFSVDDFLEAMTYQDELNPGIIERRLIVVNLLPAPASRSSNGGSRPDSLGMRRAFDILRREKAQSEGIVIVQNQSVAPPRSADNIFEFLREGLAGRADDNPSAQAHDGQLRLSELLDYIGQYHPHALVWRSGRDFPLAQVEQSKSTEEPPEEGLFLQLGTKLIEKNLDRDDALNSFPREGNVVILGDKKLNVTDPRSGRTITLTCPFKIISDDGKNCEILTGDGTHYNLQTSRLPLDDVSSVTEEKPHDNNNQGGTP